MEKQLPARDVDRSPPVVYGPVASRRFGRSLGINLMPAGLKLCTFDCTYCQCGRTEARHRRDGDPEFPSLERIRAELEPALQRHGDGLDDITFAGAGEPTLHPRFRDAVALVRELRDRAAPRALLSVLSNSTRAGLEEVRAGLALVDRPVCKLDSAVGALFHEIDRPPTGLQVERVIEWLAALPRVETQTMLVRGRLENSGPEALAALADALRRIRPVQAQLMTVARSTADAGIVPLAAAELEESAGRLRQLVSSVDIRVFV